MISKKTDNETYEDWSDNAERPTPPVDINSSDKVAEPDDTWAQHWRDYLNFIPPEHDATEAHMTLHYGDYNQELGENFWWFPHEASHARDGNHAPWAEEDIPPPLEEASNIIPEKDQDWPVIKEDWDKEE